MHSTRTVVIAASFAFLTGIFATVGCLYRYNLSRDLAFKYYRAWNTLIEITPMCKAIQEGRPKNVLLMLEAKAEGAITGLAPTLTVTGESQDKADFVYSVAKFSEYRGQYPRPSDLPPRGEEVDAAIETVLQSSK